MKNLVFTVLYVICAIFNSNVESSIGVAPTITITDNYVLYSTTNVYTFLKLNTRSGKIWQLQYSMDEMNLKLG